MGDFDYRPISIPWFTPQPIRHPNSPSGPSKAMSETGLKFSGLMIFGLGGPGNFMT